MIKQEQLLEGDLKTTVARFSLPFFGSYLLQTLYGMADLYLIGRFCDVAATTAVSNGAQIMHMVTVMLVGLSMGATVAVGRAVGAEDAAGVNRAAGNTFVLFGGLSVLAAAGLFFCVAPITGLISTPAAAVPGLTDYLRVCFAGVPFITFYNVISAVFRGMGDSKTPLYFAAAACAVNVGLDLLFIGSFHMGAAGAAWGTVLAQAASVALALPFLFARLKGTGFRKRDLLPEKRTLWALLKVGLPVALQDGFIQIAFLVITVIANRRGLTDAAAVGVVEKLIGILFLVPSTMLSTVSALGAQCFGANRPDRAARVLRCCVAVCVLWGLMIGAVLSFVPGAAVALFTKDADVIASGAQYLRSYVWDCALAGVHFCFSGYFCAMGKSGVSFFHNAVSILTARIPLAYLASVRFPETLFPMGLAAPIGSLLSAVICIIWFLVLQKKEKNQAPYPES